jgi:hypothetical protein
MLPTSAPLARRAPVPTLAMLAPRAPRAVFAPLALLLLAACGDDASPSMPGMSGDASLESGVGPEEGGTDSGVGPAADVGAPGADAGDSGLGAALDAGGDAMVGDGAPNNPPNPNGVGPAPVNLGSSTSLSAAGSYVLMAKTGITNVTGSSISGGNLGLSPAAATFITGFALSVDSTNTFATSASVVSPGKVFASDYTAPTPANLTSAVLAMQTAYTDAAGRTNPDFVNMGSGNLGGLTLAPGLYKWGTGVTVPTDVTLSGGANDVWIFQISNDVDVSAAKNVLLAGGAQARNVFWQVAGEVTIHATAHFEGIILSQTAITLQTTASMHGRALAQSLIALDNNAVTAP